MDTILKRLLEDDTAAQLEDKQARFENVWSPHAGTIGTRQLFVTELANAEDGYGTYVQRIGIKKTGRLLDGREWNELPEVAA